MSSTSVCLFHNRRYSSNIQRILNLLRIHTIKTKCDLNYIAKKSLCTCNLSDTQLTITDEEFLKREELYEKLKINLIKRNQWSDEIDKLIELRIRNTCEDKLSINKLLKLVCEISNEKFILKMIKTLEKDEKNVQQSKSIRHQHRTKLIRRLIKLSTPPSHIAYLLGRNGDWHKSITAETNTRIHFDNVPYSTSKETQYPDFNLELFQSSHSLTATITGQTIEAVDNAVKALENLDQEIQV